MTESLLATFGLYGGAFVIAFVAGMFPLVSVELFLFGVSTWATPTPGGMVALILLAAVGHQLAKTLCYVSGIGVLERPTGKLHRRIEAARPRIDRWNRRPKLILFLAATIGLPPLYLVAFIAHPLLNLRFVPFTAISFVGRIGRYAVMMLVPLVL
jgi:membrane protein YqaA with SNARE-associated domain